jgi:hypothetical protein
MQTLTMFFIDRPLIEQFIFCYTETVYKIAPNQTIYFPAA